MGIGWKRARLDALDLVCFRPQGKAQLDHSLKRPRPFEWGYSKISHGLSCQALSANYHSIMQCPLHGKQGYDFASGIQSHTGEAEQPHGQSILIMTGIAWLFFREL